MESPFQVANSKISLSYGRSTVEKVALVKVFQVISPSAHDRCNPVGSFPSWGQLPGIRVSHVFHSFSKYQICNTELLYPNISVITPSEFLLILG